MQPFANLQLDDTTELLAAAGSFWNKRMQPQSDVVNLLGLASCTNTFSRIGQMVDQLAGLPGNVEQYVTLSFNTKSVFKTGTLLYGDDVSSVTYQDDVNTFLAYNRRDINYYVIPVTTHIPRTVQAGGDQLVLGLDFFVRGDYLFFRQDPRVLWPNGRFSCPLAERVTPGSPLDFLLRCRVAADRGFVTQYMRQNQSPDAFRLALCAVAGLTITHFNQELLYVRVQGDQYVYVFEQETLRADYPHTPLTVGTTYPAGTVIGNGIQFFRDDGTGTKDWWRAIDWSGGMSLATFTPQFPFLHLNDANTILYSAGSDAGSTAGSRVHARIQLTNDFYAEQPYWDTVQQQETATRRYINGMPAAQLPEDTGSNTLANLIARYSAANALNKQQGWPLEQPDLQSLHNWRLVNALDFYFQSVFQKRGLIILVDHTQIADLQTFYMFLQREMLTGVIPIVLSRGLSLSGSDCTMTFTDSVNFNTGGLSTLITVSESVVLSSVMTDSVTLSPL